MNQVPFVTIPLRDGTQASIAHDSVRVGERSFVLGDIQDARQVAPDPETIAMRVANERHVVELQPARPGDGALLLEALFRIRPDLRPAGFEAPAVLPPGFPPSAPTPRNGQASWQPQTAYMPQPDAYKPVPPPPGYAPLQGTNGGRLTPNPRSISELIGAVFELFTAHWQRWLLLGLLALFLPEVIHGAVDAIFRVIEGGDLWAGLPLATRGASSGNLGIAGTGLPTGNDLLLTALNLLISALVGAVIGGWAAAVLGIASRDALLGRAPRASDALRLGLRRVLPASIASVLSGLLTVLFLVPVFAIYGVMLTQFGGALADPTTLDPASASATTFAVLGCLSLLLLIPGGLLAIYVGIRLALSPYIAATEPLGPLAALRKSWSLTRGQWWHTFMPLFVVALLTAIISLPASFVQYASFGVSVLLVVPLFAALTAPLAALAAVVVLYDLRLRREGFGALTSEASTREEPMPTSA